MKRKKIGLIVTGILLAGLILATVTGYRYYRILMQPNTKGEPVTLFVYPEDTYNSVRAKIAEAGLLVNRDHFDKAASILGLSASIHVGRYVLKSGWSNKQLIDKLRRGYGDPLMVTISKRRRLESLASYLSDKLLLDSMELMDLLNDDSAMAVYGLKPATSFCLFIPNTYELYWNTDAAALLKRMNRERNAYWTLERFAKADERGLSEEEVITLASIVSEETNANSEKPTIAGLYLNRLNRGMRLQADPTVKFAVGDFTIRRVLHKHLRVESPYNTYIHSGLPPGPICLPDLASIEAVLNAERHDYLYMCAKADNSGTHAFARNLREHQRNAREFHNWLNNRGIR